MSIDGLWWWNLLRWGLVVISLAGMGMAFAGNGRVLERRLGVISPGKDACVMDGALYVYDGDQDVLMRYERGVDGMLSAGKVVARFPFVLTRMVCGQGRIVGWCGRRGMEGKGIEWVAASGELREFQWPPGRPVAVGVSRDGVLMLTRDRLVRWRIGDEPGKAVVLYQAMREKEQLRGMVVDPSGKRVALRVDYSHPGEEGGGGAFVMVLELEGERAKFASQYESMGALEALASGVLWEWDSDTCERPKAPGAESWRFYPPALLARDWGTGRLLATWGEKERLFGQVRSDGKRVIALAKPRGAGYRDPVTVYELILEVDRRGRPDPRSEGGGGRETLPMVRRRGGEEVP